MATNTRQAASLLLFLAPLLLPVSSAAAHGHGHPSSTPDPRVKALCDAAPYRDPCYQSMSVLSPLAGSAAGLARAAIGLGLHAAKAATVHLSGPSAALGGPLQSCARAMGDCVDLLQQVVGELDRLAQPGSHHVDLGVGRVKGWAGKAIADANGCLHGLQDTPARFDPALIAVTQAVQLTSNALVFVGAIAPSRLVV